MGPHLLAGAQRGPRIAGQSARHASLPHLEVA